jgi:hypothetical protein
VTAQFHSRRKGVCNGGIEMRPEIVRSVLYVVFRDLPYRGEKSAVLHNPFECAGSQAFCYFSKLLLVLKPVKLFHSITEVER